MLETALDWRAIDDSLVTEDFIRDPYPTLDLLREHDPVYWSDSIGGWVLTRYDDMMVTFKETVSYSNEGRLARATEYLPPASREKLGAFENHFRAKGLLHSDPPDHTRLRKLVLKVFTAERRRGDAPTDPGDRRRADRPGRADGQHGGDFGIWHSRCR